MSVILKTYDIFFHLELSHWNNVKNIWHAFGHGFVYFLVRTAYLYQGIGFRLYANMNWKPTIMNSSFVGAGDPWSRLKFSKVLLKLNILETAPTTDKITASKDYAQNVAIVIHIEKLLLFYLHEIWVMCR